MRLWQMLVETLVARQNDTSGIALDLTSGTMYWANGGNGEIHRANLDGTDQQTLVTGRRSGAGYLSLDVSPVVSPAPLVAGDANEDFEFDQLDLVQVQIAAKYLTGQTATWGEGDWNGAPGGGKGRPPAGDGRFDQLDVIAAQLGAAYLTGPYASISRDGQSGDVQTSVIYNAGTGELAIDAPGGIELTSINIDSDAGIFTGAAAQNFGGSFDNDSNTNVFKATFGSSFGSLTFGNVAQPGLAEEFVLGDLTVVGSLRGGGALGDVDLIYVPEPSGILLLLLGALGFVTCGRCLAFAR